jgi:ComF family protein
VTDEVSKSSSLAQIRTKNVLNTVFKFLFPPVCVNCGRVGSLLCNLCRSHVIPLIQPIFGQTDLEEKRPLSQAWAATKFLEPIPKIIHKLKYSGQFALAALLAELMVETWNHIPSQEIDLVIPIPLHHEREKMRGYNQAGLLVEHFCTRTNLKADMESLRRVRYTNSQVGLSAMARQVNVNNAFWANARGVSGMRILLVDDVFTTGATMTAAAIALRHAGATAVLGFCAARAESHIDS